MPFWVYILTNKNNTVLYTGVTKDLHRRLREHRRAKETTFTGRYFVRKLVYYEKFGDPSSAIIREKQIKGGSRRKKLQLIEAMNPGWQELSEQLTAAESKTKIASAGGIRPVSQ